LARQVPWLRFLVEGMVIVGSILLAFGIDAWWDRRGLYEDETQLLLALERDLERSRAEASRVATGRERLLDRTTVFLEASPQELAALSPDSAGVLFRGLMGLAVFTPYEGSVRGDNFGLLQDSELRDALNQWVGASANIVEAAPTLYRGLEEIDRAVGVDGLTYLVLGPDSIAAASLSRLRSNEEFLVARLASLREFSTAAARARELLELTDHILVLIRGQLASR